MRIVFDFTKRGEIKGGKSFTKSRLYRLLTNPIYTGNVEFKGQVYNGEHEAIVGAETWDSVQRTLHRNGRSRRGVLATGKTAGVTTKPAPGPGARLTGRR